MDVINVGSINIDYAYRVSHLVKPGETLNTQAFEKGLGGKGMNQSIALVRAGASVAHVGAVGQNDPWVLDAVKAAGVSTTHIEQLEQTTGHAIIQVDDSAENCIILHGGANQALLQNKVIEVFHAYPQAAWVLLQNETNNVANIIEAAVSLNKKVAFNPAPVSQSIAGVDFSHVSLLIVNEIELAQITQHENADEAIRALRSSYPDTELLITFGKQGARFINCDVDLFMAAMDVDAVDTTAAGDTFVGYFLASIAKGMGPDEALSIAIKAAAICVSKPGAASSIPDLSEIK